MMSDFLRERGCTLLREDRTDADGDLVTRQYLVAHCNGGAGRVELCLSEGVRDGLSVTLRRAGEGEWIGVLDVNDAALAKRPLDEQMAVIASVPQGAGYLPWLQDQTARALDRLRSDWD